MHDDTADHTFILVDSSGKVRFVQDYPSIWIDVNQLLRELPKRDEGSDTWVGYSDQGSGTSGKD